PPSAGGSLVSGNAVISIDYFKRFLAYLRGLVGGQIDAYESLVERSRREAVLRMKQQARELGASHIVNVKLETSRVFFDDRRAGSVEVLAYGTAVWGVNPGQ
ncbi:MAG: YbjQ family protein, partial [Alphaproteobacteria bacterium]|nr:YbjQ family protein [Alphaproteobacteria bacterium]